MYFSSKVSLKMRSRAQAEMEKVTSGACWRWWRSTKDPFDEIENIPTLSQYIYHLRPWNCKPSEQYLEVLERRNYWFNHPPSVWWMLGVLALLVMANLFVALVNVAVNRTLFYQLWRDLKRPTFTYENPAVLLFVWGLAHLLSAIAAWFVYLSGGMKRHRRRMIPYTMFLVMEALIPDAFFGWRRIDIAVFLSAISIIFICISMYAFSKVTNLSPVMMLPLLGAHGYMIALASAMWDLNGGSYERTV
eukprot:Hpha_TRINITY_DN18770_c0_g1::TRINITY_DN18770_c0_g1_i1::g.47464::m.47464/K05770/TSPO, BZRP; benzodiazapine receptor